jgi:hypothetical protein
MGKKNPKKTKRTISAIKSTMSCSKIHTGQKKKSTKRVSCFETLIANHEYKTHTHLKHMKRSSIQEIEHIPIRARKSLPGFHLFFFPPTHEFLLSQKSLPISLKVALNSVSVQPSSSQPPNSFAAAHASLTSSLTKKIAVVGLEEQDYQIIRVWVLHGFCFVSNSEPVEAPNGLGKSPMSCAHKAPLLQ